MRKGDQAIENLLIAISLPPKDDQWKYCPVSLARVYTQQNDWLKALTYYKMGLENGFNLDYDFGNVFLDIGDYGKAEKYLRNRAVLETICPSIWLYNFALLAQGKFRQAFQFTDSICQVNDCERDCNANLFIASFLFNEFEQAEKYFHQVQKSGMEDGVLNLSHFMNV